jgi:hypothetical protein
LTSEPAAYFMLSTLELSIFFFFVLSRNFSWDVRAKVNMLSKSVPNFVIISSFPQLSSLFPFSLSLFYLFSISLFSFLFRSIFFSFLFLSLSIFLTLFLYFSFSQYFVLFNCPFLTHFHFLCTPLQSLFIQNLSVFTFLC